MPPRRFPAAMVRFLYEYSVSMPDLLRKLWDGGMGKQLGPTHDNGEPLNRAMRCHLNVWVNVGVSVFGVTI